MLRISRISIDNQTSNILTDDPAPVISYAIESDRMNVSVREAVIRVGDWSLRTGAQVGIRYTGEPLAPFAEYVVRIEVTDNYGETATGEATFSTGYLGQPWRAQWISDPTYRFTAKKTSPKPMTFRRRFRLDKPVRQATLCATALGIYELELNGAKVGADYFAPGFTDYRHQMQYQRYDVTAQLVDSNELLAVVGGGWAVGAYGYARANRGWADRQAFLCELRLRYADGSEEILGTDGSWEVTDAGRFREAEFYDGEVYDATVDYSALPWHRAAPEKLRFKPKLIAQYGAPVRAHEVLKPVSVTKSPLGALIYDLGQNFSGVIRAKIRGKHGQQVTFRHAEILMSGELFTEPLRSAKQRAVYICVEGEQTYSPHLTCMGFRYVEVRGIEEENIQLEGVALYSDIAPNGGFACSNELLNRMQRCIEWGAKSNFVDIPTDCPQRDERLGWTGDIALFAPVAAYNFDMSRFFDKWLRDVRAEQTRGGGIPMVVPRVNIPGQLEMMFPMAVDHWGDACILVPWAEYRARGDLNVLRENYAAMKRYVKACRFWAGLFSFGQKKFIWKLLFHYGDWCAPGVNGREWMKRGKYTATACLAHSCGILAQIAELLGEREDAKTCAKLRDDTARAYRELLMREDCSVPDEFQTAYVLPLHYGLLHGKDRDRAAGHLVRLVRENGWHIGTGFPGTPYILFALADSGHADDAYRMLLTDSCPSWLYEIKAGGTTFWERWDALREDGTVNQGEGSGMVSFNHYACGAAGDFLYRRVAGIEAIEGGYRRFRVAPIVGGGLTWAEGKVNTPYGEISSRWEIADGKFKLQVAVPAGTSCNVHLPSGERREVGSGDWRWEESIEV